MNIKAYKDFTINGIFYAKGDTIKVNKFNIDSIWKLNEAGYIEPITVKDYLKMRNEILNPAIKKKEEE